MSEIKAEQTVLPPAPSLRRTFIKGLIPQLPERGKIKIGAKGDARATRQGNTFQPPIRLDHFLITTLERGPDDNLLRDEQMHERFGDKPTELPVRLLYDDPELNFISRYACYKGRTLWCSGDGETAQRLTKDGKDHFEIACPCILSSPTYEPKAPGDEPKCRMNGALSVIIDGASGLGGVWKFRTTSYNSIVGIISSLGFIATVTGGILANIPLLLRLQPKQGVHPITGNPVSIHFVTLEFPGTMDELLNLGHQIALNRATTHLSIKHIEDEARRQLALAAPVNAPLPGDDAPDIIAEFYPDQAEAAEDTKPQRSQFRKQAIESDMTHSENVGAGGAGVVEHADGDLVSDPPGPDETGSDVFVISHMDGTETIFSNASDAADALIAELKARAEERGREGIESTWEDNRQLWDEFYLYDDAHTLCDRVSAAYQEILEKIEKAEAVLEKRDARLASRPKQGKTAPITTPITAFDASSSDPMGGAGGGAGPTGDQPGSVTDGRNITCKTITYGPGRGTNWRETEKGVIDFIRTLTNDEYPRFREANKVLLANMNLAWKDGMARVNRALVERDEALR